MKIRFGYLLGVAASCVLIAAPAQARRTAIDQITNPDGSTSSTSTTLAGYCDLDGDQCGESKALGYDVSFDGGKTLVNSVTITGNGLLAFGSLLFPDGSTLWDTDVNGSTVHDLITNFSDPALVDYQRNLVSAGQNNGLDGSVFMQSADLKITNGIIKAEWFTCYAPGAGCRSGLYSLTLTPTATGFKGAFSAGQGGDYVVNGQQVAVGNSFFLPATIIGLASAVPEPASWAMMIAGFGLVGGTLRRRSVRPQPALA